jgi:N-acetyl sugar amidotransferase
MKISYPRKPDLTKFSDLEDCPEAYYGLPQEVVFCKQCIYSNQKPNSAAEYKHTAGVKKDTVKLSKDGICHACVVNNAKPQTNWLEREDELLELLDKYRRNDGSYDCLVPGSGGKDSFYTSHILKYKYGMNPLTITFAPHMYTTWGLKNFNSWLNSGFDNYLFTPNPLIHRLLTRLSLEQLLHPFQPFMMGQMLFPPKFAIQNNIELVFYGENPTEYGNQDGSQDRPTKELGYFSSENPYDVYIAGVHYDELVSEYKLNPVDLEKYCPINANQINNYKLNVQYLGYYLPWHPQEFYYYAVEKGGFIPSPERTCGTYSKYSSIDDKIDDLHYYTTFIKFGIGRTTYDASQEIRNGEIEREEGLALAKRYDGEYPERFMEEILDYLSVESDKLPVQAALFEQPKIDRQYFDDLIDSFRSPHLWKYEDSYWQLKNKAYE